MARSRYNKIDSRNLERLKEIAGENNVISDKEKMQDYSHDEFSLAEAGRIPEAVIKPRSAGEISEILRIAAKEGFPVTPRGGGTGLCGGCVPVSGGIVISFENMNRILEIDTENLMAVVEAGVTLREFYAEVEKAGFFFPRIRARKALLSGV